MSDEGRAYVKENSPFTGATFWVHYVMGDLANKQNSYEIWIGDKRLAEEWAPLSVRAIQRARSELVEAGFLTILDDKSGPGRPIRYRFEFQNTRQVGDRSESNTRHCGEQHPPGMSEHPPNASSAPITNQRTEVEPKTGTSLTLVSESALPPLPDPFDIFWAIYPHKAEKIAARKAWVKALKIVSVGELIDGVTRYRDDPNREPSYTKNPATWLNKGCWTDPPLAPRSKNGKAGADSAAWGTIGRLISEGAES